MAGPPRVQAAVALLDRGWGKPSDGWHSEKIRPRRREVARCPSQASSAIFSFPLRVNMVCSIAVTLTASGFSRSPPTVCLALFNNSRYSGLRGQCIEETHALPRLRIFDHHAVEARALFGVLSFWHG